MALWNAFHAGDQAECRRLHERLLRLWNAIDAPNLPANVKTALRFLGHPGAALPRSGKRCRREPWECMGERINPC